MNKTYFRIRCIIAWVTGMLCFLAFFSAFYPVKIFDLQLTALLQRFLVDVSLTAAILLSALLLLTLFFGRVYCSTLCPFGLLQEFLMLFSDAAPAFVKTVRPNIFLLPFSSAYYSAARLPSFA